MNRKYILFGNLVLLVGFAAGYAAAFFTVKKIESTPKPDQAIVAQEVAPPVVEPTQEIASPRAVAVDDTDPVVKKLEAQLAERNAKITELQQNLSGAPHDTVAPEEDTIEYREKLAADLMEVTRTKEMIQQSFKSSAQLMGKDLGLEGQEALNASLQKFYSWDKMERMFSKVYTDVFSAQELNDMTEFYRSEVGTNMLKKQPEVMQKTLQLVQQINQEIQPKLQAELEAITKKNKEKPKPTASKN